MRSAFYILCGDCCLAEFHLDFNPDKTDPSFQELRVVSRLQGHISSIRSLASSRSYKSIRGINAVVLLSGGGRAQLMARRIWPGELGCHDNNAQESSSKTTDEMELPEASSISHVPHDGVPTKCQHLSEQLASHTVIGDVDMRKSRTWRSKEYVFDPETRVMSMTMFTVNDLDSGNLIISYLERNLIYFVVCDTQK